MTINNEIIDKFRKVYFEEFGEEISKEEAYDKFHRLVNLLRTIVKVSTKRDQSNESSSPFLFDEDFKNAKLKE